MRKHGWKLPYHPLQVVAIAVFLALGFAFYVFFAPFVGKNMFQYIVMGIYTPLIVSAFSLYIWCAAADPADPGVFKSKKYLKIPETGKNISPKDSKLSGDCTASLNDASAAVSGGKHVTEDLLEKDAASICSTVDFERKISSERPSCFLLARSPCAFICNCFGSSKESSIQQISEEGMFYCNLCEVEVFKYSKHCRVCDKCVDSFDHHCRWLNNCIGKRNYRQFFTLMVASLLLLILQWTTGILVLVCCFLERKQFSVEISAKLGSSFTLVPFVVVVAVCTLLAMIATLPIVQLIFFHILLIKKGISTYDYIIALREQEQEQEQQGVGVQQSPQMSPASSLTGLSSASSFTNFHRGAWCTPQRLFLEDQFDVVPPETGSVSSFGKKVTREEPTKKKNPGAVKISPWTLARLNAEEVSKAAAEARKRSKILQPVARHDGSFGIENEGSFGSSRRRMFSKPENNRKRGSKRVRLRADLPMEPLAKVSSKAIEKDFTDTSSGLAPLQLEAQNAFQTNQVISRSMGIVASSPESSLDSPDIHPFRLSSSKAEETRWLSGLAGLAAESRFPLSRSTSDGYEASGGEDSDRVPSRMTQRTTNWSNGGEDSDRVPSRMTQRTTNWSNVLFRSDRDERIMKLKALSSTEKAMIN